MEIKDFIHLIRYISIVHHIPGRIRLKINKSILDEPILKNLEDYTDFLKIKVPGIQTLRINKAALTIIIEYDPQKIPLTRWEQLINSTDDQERTDTLNLFLLDE